MTGDPVTGTPASIWALIPVKARGAGKTRLAPALCPDERAALVEEMLAHVAGVAGEVVGRTVLLGPAREELARAGVEAIADPGGGLNAALGHALGEIAARADAPARVIVLAADLPALAAGELARLAALPAAAVGLAPDRHGTGTNALSLPLPEVAGWRFHYGTGSADRHRDMAQMLGLNAVTITAPGLAKDIDEPADLADARGVSSYAT